VPNRSATLQPTSGPGVTAVEGAEHERERPARTG
jgi:hypothetical protein